MIHVKKIFLFVLAVNIWIIAASEVNKIQIVLNESSFKQDYK